MEKITVKMSTAILVLLVTAALSSGITFMVTHYETAVAQAVPGKPAPAAAQNAAPSNGIRVDDGARF